MILTSHHSQMSLEFVVHHLRQQTPKKNQQDLNCIYRWQTKNNMVFNENKFGLQKWSAQIIYLPKWQRNKNVHSLRDLGWKWKTHNFKKTYKQLMCRSETTFWCNHKKLYNKRSYSCCLYFNQSWSPSQNNQILKFENLLRSYTNKIYQLSHVSDTS